MGPQSTSSPEASAKLDRLAASPWPSEPSVQSRRVATKTGICRSVLVWYSA